MPKKGNPVTLGKRKKKKEAAPVLCKVVGAVHLGYVQYGVPKSEIKAVCEALARVILSDYQRAFCIDDKGEE